MGKIIKPRSNEKPGMISGAFPDTGFQAFHRIDGSPDLFENLCLTTAQPHALVAVDPDVEKSFVSSNSGKIVFDFPFGIYRKHRIPGGKDAVVQPDAFRTDPNGAETEEGVEKPQDNADPDEDRDRGFDFFPGDRSYQQKDQSRQSGKHDPVLHIKGFDNEKL